jgi:ABC-type glutathione transport system ATPase component
LSAPQFKAPLPALAPLLEIRDLRVSFRSDGRHMTEVVHGVSFSVAPRSTVALVGESGSGKSVSALAVMGLLPARVVRSILPAAYATTGASCWRWIALNAAPCAGARSR